MNGRMMKAIIYKGHKKPDSYLYIEDEDDFSRVPEELLAVLGRLELVMTLELTPQRKLIRADVTQVITALSEEGFYLQMPDKSDKLALAGIKPVSNPIPKM